LVFVGFLLTFFLVFVVCYFVCEQDYNTKKVADAFYEIFGKLGLEYTLCLKNVCHLMFVNNFGNCGPIFKILLPVDS